MWVKVTLAGFYLCKGTARNIAAAHLKLGGDLFL